MLTVRILPCLDVRDGRVVKGVKFANLRDMGSPAELAARYEKEGADEIVFLDVSATREERAAAHATIRSVRERLSIPLTVGGGVRSLEDAASLLEAGADKVSINSAAVRDPSIVRDIARTLGAQCAVVAVDAARTASGAFEVLTHSGTEKTGLDAIEWCRQAVSLGAGEILLTSFDRDGTRSGYDVELIEAVASAVRVPVIASGGAANAGHMLDALRAGAHAVLAASIFHEEQDGVGRVKRFLAEKGVEVRI